MGECSGKSRVVIIGTIMDGDTPIHNVNYDEIVIGGYMPTIWNLVQKYEVQGFWFDGDINIYSLGFVYE